MLGHDECALQPARFTDIDLVGPVPVVGEFVAGKSPLGACIADVPRHAGIVGQEVEQALLVTDVLPDDLFPDPVGTLRIRIVQPDVVSAEGSVVVHIHLGVRNRVELPEGFPPARFEHPEQQFVLLRIVAGRFGERHAVLGHIGEAQPEAVSLDPAIPAPVRARRLRTDARQQAA